MPGVCNHLNPRCGNKKETKYVPCSSPTWAPTKTRTPTPVPTGAPTWEPGVTTEACCIDNKGDLDVACADPLGCYVLTCEQPRLSRKAFLTIAVTAASLIAMMRDVAPDLSMLAATLVLLLWPWGKANGGGNILTGPEAWQGFSNEAVLSVGALFIVAKGVDETGTVDRMFRRLLGKTKNLVWAQLRLLLPVAVMSAS